MFSSLYLSVKFSKNFVKIHVLLAFHAFLRVGEFTCLSKSGKQGHTLLVEHVQFTHTSSIITGMEITFKSFKHSKGKEQIIFVASCNHDIDHCPVHALNTYFSLRQPQRGPIFTFMDGTPMSRSFFTQQLNLSLVWAGCSTSCYKGHSFRIGAASTALTAGIAEAKIQSMGRWSSNACKRYIRIPMLSL